MKNIYKLVTLCIALTTFSFSGMAQYRNYHLQEIESIEFDKYGDPISKSGRGTLKPPTREDDPFRFDIRFNDVNILLQLEAARRQAAAAKFNKWLAEQRSVLLKEINKQLNTKHTNFNTAKNDYFKNYEKNRLKVESRASTEAWKLSNRAKKLDVEQKTFTSELYAIGEWKTLGSWCGVHNSDKCDLLSSISIRGTSLGSTSNSSLSQLYNRSLTDFSNREFQSAQNIRWSTGIRRIINDHSLLNTVVNNRIKHFDRLYLDEQIYLMINYLSTYYYTPAPVIKGLPNPDYQIPTLWNNGTILTMGKKRAPGLSQETQVFQPGYIEGHAGPCNNLEWSDWLAPGDCDPILGALYQLRDNVIQRHINEIDTRPFFVEEDFSNKVDPKKETKCFDKTKSAKITIYVEQPIPNSREITADIGHTFIGIEQGNISRYLGFYPDTPSATLIGDKQQPAEIHDNSGSPFDVSISTTVTPQQLSQIIDSINDFPETYDLENYNCSDFGIQIGKKAGLPIPATVGKYSNILFKFEGRNPADLGEDIRDIDASGNIIINETSGKAPKKKGKC